LVGRAGLQVGEAYPALTDFELREQSAQQPLQELVNFGSFYVSAGAFDRPRTAEGSSLVELKSQEIADLMLALMQMQQRDLSAAGATAKRLTDAFPNEVWSNSLSGTIALASGDHAAARAHFSRTLEIDPGYVPALLNSAQAALALNDREGATAHLLRAIEINPEQPTALLGLARLAEDRGDFAEARSWLERMSGPAAKERLDDRDVSRQ
jgi:Tfp pilus assembly protein PilF